MVHFLSCDWGTSSFRLRLVDAESADIIAFRKADRGIAATFNNLDDRKKEDPEQRLLFYLRIIQEHISEIEQDQNISLKGVPLVISGMASSSIGMAELPYRNLPFSIDGSDIEAAYFEVSANFAHPVLLISGVKSEVDVMRGEETQLIGTIRDSTAVEGQVLYIFPGTHSKHIVVKGKQVIDFKTYMTGEFFALLSKQSILKGVVEWNDDLQTPNALQSFKEGVRDAKGANLLHMAFRVRTNDLFEKLTKKENYHYLSGLLIGAELDGIKPSDYAQVSVCSDSGLRLSYETALETLGLKEKAHVFPDEWTDEAVVRGQLKIYKQFTRKL
ncbi:2-keto-3-deoxy-galactonokinase [Pontibacter diazotrophicus]|uniref:2-keto-3-deoxy-galactonokinase n=1 Tax=Pontibacter diazotrophicus TaxID=1400979 RepID=A0A3D8LIX9_9BACT|nr:2-dehydro-3-deoxygalactonokinase [Pontibacter diazotrophicus]RDV16882.1 2-keto-3-deoxy-galactonokinase [Pontibacter diazotrophicus]